MCKNDKGVLTLEACLALPVFIAIMLFVNGVFMIFMGQQKISHALIQSMKSLALDPYATQRLDGEDSSGLSVMFSDILSLGHGDYISHDKWYESGYSGLEDLVKTRFAAYLAEDEGQASEMLKALGVHNGLSGIDFSGSSIDFTTGILKVKMSYVQKFVLDTFGYSGINREITLQVNLFMNKEI